MNKYLKKVLEEMFKRVEAQFSEDLIREPDWYMEYTWTDEEQNDFGKWLEKYIKENINARKELVSYPTLMNRKEQRIKFVNEFLLNYGWRIKDVC